MKGNRCLIHLWLSRSIHKALNSPVWTKIHYRDSLHEWRTRSFSVVGISQVYYGRLGSWPCRYQTQLKTELFWPRSAAGSAPTLVQWISPSCCCGVECLPVANLCTGLWGGRRGDVCCQPCQKQPRPGNHYCRLRGWQKLRWGMK